MSKHRSRRLDRRTAEQLLSGAPAAGRPAGALGGLLNAAAGPAREGELAGERAAMVAFQAAHLDPVPQTRRPSMLKATLAGLLTAKILAPAAALAAVGGVTLAGAAGVLPIPDDSPANPPARSTSAPRSASVPPGDPQTPASALVGLCQAYVSGAANNGKALDSKAFRVLAVKAGGAQEVDGYCADLLADRTGKPEDIPSPADHPTGAPATTPAHPTPTTQPDPPANTPAHPTGPPDDKPKPPHPTGPQQ